MLQNHQAFASGSVPGGTAALGSLCAESSSSSTSSVSLPSSSPAETMSTYIRRGRKSQLSDQVESRRFEAENISNCSVAAEPKQTYPQAHQHQNR